VLPSIKEDFVAAAKVELFERIRRDSWREGLSVRALARKYGVHRRLVREELTSAEPAPQKTPVRRSPQLEPLKEVIDGWLCADLDAPRKQRHTVTRIHARLVSEHGVAGVPSVPARLIGRQVRAILRSQALTLPQLTRPLSCSVPQAVFWHLAGRSPATTQLARRWGHFKPSGWGRNKPS
jgi:hypothetical protein